MISRIGPVVTKHASRAADAAANAVGERLRRRGYVTPAERALARETDRILLDPVEAGFVKASMHGQGYGRIAAHVRLEGPIVTQAALQSCLRALQARHPYLRRAVAKTPLGLALVPHDGPIPLVEHAFDGDLNVEELWKKLERRSLRPGEPLARVHVVRLSNDESRTDFIVELEHAICDGASLTRFGCELVEQLSAFAESGAPQPAPPLPLSASLNARCAERMGGRARALTRMVGRMARNGWQFRELPPTGLARDASQGYQECYTHILRASLDAEESEQLFQAARQQRVSVMNLLTAAFALSIGARVSEAAGNDEQELRLLLSVTASLRHRYAEPVPTEQLGVHISGVDPSLVLSSALSRRRQPSDLWGVARELRAQLREAMRPGEDAHWLLAYATGTAVTLALKLPKIDLCSLLITDSAPFPTPERIGVYRLRDVRPLNNGRAHSYPYVIVSKSPAGLHLSLFAPVPAFCTEDLQAVLDGVTADLRALLQEASAPVSKAS